MVHISTKTDILPDLQHGSKGAKHRGDIGIRSVSLILYTPVYIKMSIQFPADTPAHTFKGKRLLSFLRYSILGALSS